MKAADSCAPTPGKSETEEQFAAGIFLVSSISCRFVNFLSADDRSATRSRL
jgi:hypothetical protein